MAANIVPFPGIEANDNFESTPPPAAGFKLRLVSGGRDDPETAFARAYHDVMIAKAERELVEARWMADHCLNVGAYSPLWEQREPAFQKMWSAVERIADIPAMTRSQLRRKKTAIGKLWLCAEGKLYDGFRASVERDEERLRRVA